MSGTAEAHGGATFVKAPDAPSTTPAVTPPAAAVTPPATTPATTPVVPAVAPAAPVVPPVAADPAAPIVGAVTPPAADPAKDPPAADPAKDPAAEKPVALKAEDYKLTFSAEIADGAKDPLVSGFLPIAAELGLPNEAVQALLDKMGPVIRNQQDTAWTTLQTQWQTEFKADPKLGGANLDATVARLNGAITQFADDPAHAKAVGEAMAITGAGNNLPIQRFINNLVARLSEGTPVSGNGAGADSKASAGDVLYNHPTSKPGAPAVRG